MCNKGGTRQPDSASGSGGSGGRRLGLEIPAWSLAAVTLFYAFTQALIMAGGDYKTAMRIIVIADRMKLLSTAACAVAIILSPIAFMLYWIVDVGDSGNSKVGRKLCIGVAINLLVLPFLPTSISGGAILAQALVVPQKAIKLRSSFLNATILISSVGLLVVSFLAPGLAWEKQVIYLERGAPVIGPVLGDLDTRVAVLDYRVDVGDGGYAYRENEIPKITMVAKDKITSSEFCDGGPFGWLVKPLYSIVLEKKDRAKGEQSCSSKMEDWSNTYGRN